MNTASDYGIKWGETIPLVPHPKYQGFMTIANAPPLHHEVLYTVQYIANICVDKIVPMMCCKGLGSLTKREIEILTLKSEGLVIKALSNQLNLSNSTIVFHLKNIRDKLGVSSTEQALIKFQSVRE